MSRIYLKNYRKLKIRKSIIIIILIIFFINFLFYYFTKKALPLLTNYASIEMERIVNTIINNSSTKEVIKKLDTEKEVKKYYDIIESIVSKLRPDEQMCFKAEYLDPMDEETLADKLSISVWTVVQIRKSCIIKFALALDLAVLKGE